MPFKIHFIDNKAFFSRIFSKATSFSNSKYFFIPFFPHGKSFIENSYLLTSPP